MNKRSSLALGASLLVTTLVSSAQSWAGIPECGNLRLEDATACELRVSGSCTAGCEEFGVYKKKCATVLWESCRKTDCTFTGEATCQDPCTAACEMECDRGENITCQHNCFVECKGMCDDCDDDEDPETCRASCEATCDGECDSQCNGVDGDCYYQCAECCHGSCSAEANLDCQTECQQNGFELCEYEFKADCEASCDGEGSLFCDGEFVLTGNAELVDCAEALVERGLLEVEIDADIDLNYEPDADGGGKIDAQGSACALRLGQSPVSHSRWLLGAGLVALLFTRRRRRGAGPGTR